MATDKLTKIEREYNEIRKNQSLTARERIAALLAIDTEKRPGGAIVAEKQANLRAKLQDLHNRVHGEVTVYHFGVRQERLTPLTTQEVIAAQRGEGRRYLRTQVYNLYNQDHYDCFGKLNAIIDAVRDAVRKYAEQVPELTDRQKEYLEAMRDPRAARIAARRRRLMQLGAQWCEEIKAARTYDLDRRDGWPRRLFGVEHATAKLTDLAADSGTARVNGWLVRCTEDETVDWNAYSKAWHHAYGPKRTIENRRVIARRVNEQDQIEERVYYVDGWRGNYALKAVIAMGIVAPVKVAARLRPVQLHEAFTVHEVRKIAGVTLYERTLAGEHYDYCALWHGLTFHADSLRACVAGLRAKVAEVERKKNATIDFKFCRSLGFCEEGIKQFARDFNLDVNGSYTADEIAAAVKGDLHTASKFTTELKKLADVVGYTIPAQFAL